MKKRLLTLGTIGAILFTACGPKDEPTDWISVTGVTLNYTNHTLNLDDHNQVQLVATVYPHDATDQTVRWESNNPAVATVDDSGLVTAVSEGKATITVFTEDTTSIERRATCLITVDTDFVPPVNQLPSKAKDVYTYDGSSTDDGIREFEYDNQNRLTKIMRTDPDGDYALVEISYGDDGKPSEIKETRGSDDGDGIRITEYSFRYEGNTVFVTIDEEDEISFTTNNRQQVTKIFEDEYTYDQQGNLIGISEVWLWEDDGGESGEKTVTATVTNSTTAEAIFRHANSPDWLIFLFVDWTFSKYGHMPVHVEWSDDLDDDETWSDSFNYTLEDDYVKTRVATWTRKDSIEEIFRKKSGAKRNRKSSDVDEFTTTTFEYIDVK
jgi:hypothetical protein